MGEVVLFWIETHSQPTRIKAVSWSHPERPQAPMIFNPTQIMRQWLEYYQNPVFNHFGSDEQNLINLYNKIGDYLEPIDLPEFIYLDHAIFNDPIPF